MFSILGNFLGQRSAVEQQKRVDKHIEKLREERDEERQKHYKRVINSARAEGRRQEREEIRDDLGITELEHNVDKLGNAIQEFEERINAVEGAPRMAGNRYYGFDPAKPGSDRSVEVETVIKDGKAYARERGSLKDEMARLIAFDMARLVSTNYGSAITKYHRKAAESVVDEVLTRAENIGRRKAEYIARKAEDPRTDPGSILSLRSEARHWTAYADRIAELRKA